MAGKPFSFKKPDEPKPAPVNPERMPTNAELLYELRKHGAKPPPRGELPAVSRRTRDFLLLTGIGCAAITAICFRVLHESDAATVLRLVMTAVALFVGLLWFVFYGVMSRY